MRERLEEAMGDGRVISLDRSAFEHDDEIGYVVAMGTDLFVLLRVADNIRFDGFSVLRIADVNDVEVPHEHDEFVESALRLRGETVDEPPEIDLSDWMTEVRSAGRLGEVITLHSEERDAGICQIGHIRSVNDENVTLVEIDPDADWYEEPTTIAIADLTRIDVGGSYEEALVLVGGSCPIPILRSVD